MPAYIRPRQRRRNKPVQEYPTPSAHQEVYDNEGILFLVFDGDAGAGGLAGGGQENRIEVKHDGETRRTVELLLCVRTPVCRGGVHNHGAYHSRGVKHATGGGKVVSGSTNGQDVKSKGAQHLSFHFDGPGQLQKRRLQTQVGRSFTKKVRHYRSTTTKTRRTGAQQPRVPLATTFLLVRSQAKLRPGGPQPGSFLTVTVRHPTTPRHGTANGQHRQTHARKHNINVSHHSTLVYRPTRGAGGWKAGGGAQTREKHFHGHNSRCKKKQIWLRTYLGGDRPDLRVAVFQQPREGVELLLQHGII